MNRKIAQILSIFVFAEFICTGCRMKKTYDEIPFVQGISVTPIVKADMGDAILLFRIDTGSEGNILFRSGADRLYGSAAKYEEENIYPELKKIGKTDKEIRDMIDHYSTTDTQTVINVPVLNVGKHEFYNVDFNYYPDMTSMGVDGIIGIKTLKEYKNVVFDFKNNKMVFNMPPVSNTSVEMNIAPLWNIPEIEVNINGKADTGLIDTGAEVILLKKENEKDTNKILKYVKEEMNKKSTPEDVKIAKMYIGNVLYKNINAFYASDSRLSFSDSSGYVQKSMSFKNDLGCPLWLNHCIQLDFEHMQFRIK
jgi:hypothetical protein